MSSTKSSVTYHKRMANNNSIDVDKVMNDNSSTLFYEEEQKKTLQISKVAEQWTNTRLQGNSLNAPKLNPQHVLNEEQWSNPQSGSTTHNENDNVINIQLSYDLYTPTELELWDGSFHPISLYRSFKHLVLDAKNIKDSLNADKQSNSLRRKISAKFTPKVQLAIGKNNKEINKPKPIQIKQIPLPIPAKSQKKVNIILKYFKSNKLNDNSKPASKSYTQASKQNISMSEVIKIKEAFLSIDAQKINQINNIIKGNLKPKPYIQMTTKSPLRKQVIILMSKDNISNFIKNSSLHVSNINRSLRNVKSEVLVDFIYSDPLDIMSVTNKVSL